MTFNQIRLSFEDVRHDAIPCSECGVPLMADDTAFEVLDGESEIACSRTCAQKALARLGFIETPIYGRSTLCRVLDVHGGGTVDVERMSDGMCFRVSGLAQVRAE